MKVNITRNGLHHCLIGLVAGLSLLVSPAAACLCDDFPEVGATEIAHVHQHHDSDDNSVEFSHRHECTCTQPSAAAMVKSEGVSLEKHFVVLSVLPRTETNASRPIKSLQPQTSSQDALRELFYSSEPSRGPPAL